MTPGRKFNLVTGACVAAALAWWFWPISAVTKLTVIRAVPAQDASAPEVSPQSEPAVMPPVEPPPVVDLVPAATPADPQANLSTAIPDVIRLAQAGDFLALIQTYMAPDDLAKMSEDEKTALSQNPETQQRMQNMVRALESIRGAAPALNAAGDQATFTPMALPELPPTVTFARVNGRWYILDK